MEGLKQRSWIVVPLLACVVAIVLIAMRAPASPFGLGSTSLSTSAQAGTIFGAQTIDPPSADWTMEGFNPARTRAREAPLSQPITQQRAVTIPGDTGDGSPPAIADQMLVVEAPNDLRAVDLVSGKQRWLVSMPGTYVSPAIVDKRVFVRSEADNKGQILALDLETGKQLWAFIPKHISSPSTNYYGGHLTSPVVTDGRVIVGAGQEVYAIDAATGHGVWEASTQDLITSSATVHNGHVYIADFTHVYALDVQTGAQLWTYKTDSSISFAPIATDQNVFVTNGDYLVALDVASGKERWTVHYPDEKLVPGAVLGSLVYLKSTTNLYAIDIQTGKEVWRFHNSSFVSLPVVAGQDAFVVAGMGPASALAAIDTRTGQATWRMDVPNLSNTAPIIAGQTIYVRTTDGRVVSFWH